MKRLLFLAWIAFSGSVLLFAILELCPRLVRHAGLDRRIRYYELTARYRPNPELVLEPRTLQRSGRYSWQGDLYSPVFGIDVPRVEYRTSFDALGFRSNSSPGPYDVLLIGDSYIEIGETDALTLSELLKQTSGLSTYNLGRSWYGPDQYLELLRKFAPSVRPRIAAFCFFSGNDAQDMVMFERWRRGGEYYDFLRKDLGIAGHYFRALRDTVAFVERAVNVEAHSMLRARTQRSGRRETDPEEPPHSSESFASVRGQIQPAVHPDLALVQLGDAAVPMRLRYMDRPLTAEQLLGLREWGHLRSVLSSFSSVAARYGIEPVVLFIPTALETYAEQIRDDSGGAFLAEFRAHHGYESAQRDALSRIAADLGIEFIDLLPEFRRHAADGELLYYPFDTHWMPSARRVAAEVMAESLRPLLAIENPAGPPQDSNGRTHDED